MTVLWPEREKNRAGSNANDYSLVSLFSLRGTSFLQAADITGTYESYAAHPADLLKAAHHGSASSTSPQFLAAVNPRAILLPCDKVSRAESFSARVGEIPVWSTAKGGALTVRFEDDTFTVTPFLSHSDPGGR